jgi:hypothetical protein
MWKKTLSFLHRRLIDLAIFLELVWVFFPALLLLGLSIFLFISLLQGQDVIAGSLEKQYAGLFFMTGFAFWQTVTWYTSRLIAYNHDRLYSKATLALLHTPRLLGYACSLVVWLAFFKLWTVPGKDWIFGLMTILDIVLYFLLHEVFQKINNRLEETRLEHTRNMTRAVLLATGIPAGYLNQLPAYLISLPFLQAGFLFLAVTRRKTSGHDDENAEPKSADQSSAIQKKYLTLLSWILRDPDSSRTVLKNILITTSEKKIFLRFNLLALLAISIYFLAVFNLDMSRLIGSFPFALLAFGILLGAGNLVSLFSKKLHVNLHVLFFAAVFIVGLFTEPHDVRLQTVLGTSAPELNQRPGLKEYFSHWIAERKKELENPSTTVYPVFFALADGGASRSGYWTASVFGRIEDKTQGKFSRHLFCLSGASGGSLGNSVFYSILYRNLSKPAQDMQVPLSQAYLSNDFLSYTLARMLGPDLFKPLFPFNSVYDRAAALERSLESVAGNSGIDSIMAGSISLLLQKQFDLPVLCINTTRMQDGRPGVVSTIRADSTIFGRRLDVLGLLGKGQDVRLSTLVIMGARFPYVSPAGRINEHYFVDGGYFDNSGAGFVHEMILELQRLIRDSLSTNNNHYLKKLKFFVLHTTNSPLSGAEINKVHPMINDLAAPVKTLIGAYSTQTYINNLRLIRYLQSINGGDLTYIPFHLYKNGEKERYPMNWVISGSSLSQMNRRLDEYGKLNHFIRAFMDDSLHGRNQFPPDE